jgi:hypothetical protein
MGQGQGRSWADGRGGQVDGRNPRTLGGRAAASKRMARNPRTLGEKERRDRCASARGEWFLRAGTDYDYGGPPAATPNVIDPQAATPRAASALIA